MPDPALFDEIDAWIPEVIAVSLARDIESRLHEMIAALAADLAPMSHRDSRIEAEVLHRTRDKLGAIEARLAREVR